MARCDEGIGMPWRLTDAGAFRLLLGLITHPNPFDLFISYYIDSNKETLFAIGEIDPRHEHGIISRVISKDPHEAIAQAELARLAQR